MASKTKTIYACTECGAESTKWYGRCPSCGAWNTMEEQIQNQIASTGVTVSSATVQSIANIVPNNKQRYHTGMKELDRVLGGGIVRGGLMLIGGDPGIGKSTLLLQICEHLGADHKILYVSGEESEGQIKLRADRLGVTCENLYVLCENDLGIVLSSMQEQTPDIVIIDSIQTMNLAEVASASGSVTQVRECTSAIMRVAKRMDIPVFIVGHVNKDGAIAGPKVMEHIVDCVLYFEGDRHFSYRLLRCVKNRYGSTNEIGVFEMGETGLTEVSNPSAMLLEDRPVGVSGSCAVCIMEGTRPLIAEIQALVTPTIFPSPRRTANGIDYNRMCLLLAVLEKRLGLKFSAHDVYLNVIGGLRLDEPAIDAACCLAMISSLRDIPVPDDVIAFGELGLSGEFRSVASIDQRVNEAFRLGFTKIALPKKASLKNADELKESGVELMPLSGIYDALKLLGNGDKNRTPSAEDDE